MYMPSNMKIKMLKFKLLIPEWFKDDFLQSQKIWKHDVTGFKFRSHGAKGRQIPRVSVSSTIYVLYDFLNGKVKKNILLWKSPEPAEKKFQRFSHSYLTVLNDGFLASRSGNIPISHDFSNLEDFSTSISLILPLSSYYLFHMVTLPL